MDTATGKVVSKVMFWGEEMDSQLAIKADGHYRIQGEITEELRYVGLTDDGVRVNGTVSTVLRQGDDVTLQLNTGWRLSIDNIELIHEPAPQPAPTP